MKKTKWFIYTVCVGLIPFLIRTLIFLFDKTCTCNYWINAVDIIMFSLVLNIANINELEDKDFNDKKWKTQSIGGSVLMLIFLTCILGIITYSDFKSNRDLNILLVKICSSGLAIVSFIFSYSIFNRLNAINDYE